MGRTNSESVCRQSRAAVNRRKQLGGDFMRVNIVKPQDLGDGYLSEWRRLQRLDPLLESPYLCSEFIQIAAQIRHGVVVVVAEEGGYPVAFLPMQLRGIPARLRNPEVQCDTGMG
jgi:CelD/BcsL family acetyltransferase involved in cellulose biosynthesis